MRTVLALSIAWLAALPARADSIPPPPACPPGARGDASHDGLWCVAWPCTDDSQCEGARCQRWRVCTRFASVQPGGHHGFQRPPVRRELVVATCDPATRCRGTEEPPPSVAGTFEPGAPACRDSMFCVPEPLPELPFGASTPAPARDAPRSIGSPRQGSCGCGASGRSGGSIFGCALVIAWMRRRR